MVAIVAAFGAVQINAATETLAEESKAGYPTLELSAESLRYGTQNDSAERLVAEGKGTTSSITKGKESKGQNAKDKSAESDVSAKRKAAAARRLKALQEEKKAAVEEERRASFEDASTAADSVGKAQEDKGTSSGINDDIKKDELKVEQSKAERQGMVNSSAFTSKKEGDADGAVEKAAAEKVAAEKAAAEKKAAEKIAREKADAARMEAIKRASEKAAAEREATAKKIAAERANTQKYVPAAPATEVPDGSKDAKVMLGGNTSQVDEVEKSTGTEKGQAVEGSLQGAKAEIEKPGKDSTKSESMENLSKMDAVKSKQDLDARRVETIVAGSKKYEKAAKTIVSSTEAAAIAIETVSAIVVLRFLLSAAVRILNVVLPVAVIVGIVAVLLSLL